MSKYLCDNDLDCLNTKLDELDCANKTTLASGFQIKSVYVCNDVCESWGCEDEAICNGFVYGLYCKDKLSRSKKANLYVHPAWICDKHQDCRGGEDEANCTASVENTNKCKHGTTKRLVPVHNFTKCHALDPDWPGYCRDLREIHTNCSDSAKVAGSCRVNGHLSTVSKHVLCHHETGERNRICDDAMESKCLFISKSCYAHKHVMCDERQDCKDNSDELHSICRSKSQGTCQRKFGKIGKSRLPLAWIGDGVVDCLHETDEKVELWPTCGIDKTFRLVTSNKSCENVFMCLWGSPGYVELNHLCDGLETCGDENRICSLSRGLQKLSTSVIGSKNGLVKRFPTCFRGVQSIENLKRSKCSETKFIFPEHKFFGVEKKTELIFPNLTALNCDYMYGELYLYSSCLNRCQNSSCPLRNPPRYEACPNQYPQRIGTIANDRYLAFFVESYENVYTNNIFVCDNKIKCIQYSQVCDLVDDCGDMSDEKFCTNHFTCNSSRRLIPKTKKCDKQLDCVDLSDECNDQCSKQIVDTPFLKILSFTIGCLACIANTATILRNIWTLSKCKTSTALINKSLIIMLSLGDSLVGCYLLVIVSYDVIIFGSGYCLKQIEWITSDSCSMVGIISTIGSQVSLFSMVGLSLSRAKGIKNSFRSAGEVTSAVQRKIIIGEVLITSLSVAIAVVPVVGAFEDFFVNGVRFSEQLQLFVGTPTKQDILPVIEAYYGRMKKTNLSWDVILEMIRGMFSHDFDYEDHSETITKVHFYGNDGVCLFKYFVKNQDPQKYFVWAVLATNFFCFVLITISYISISMASGNTAKQFAKVPHNRVIARRNQKLNRKVAFIITTDFCCWVPFILICALHSLETLDATPWYSLFSIIILPINSVINPLLYDDVVISVIKSVSNFISVQVFRLKVTQRRSGVMRGAGSPDQVIHMAPIETRKISDPVTVRVPKVVSKNEHVSRVS